VLKSSSAPPEYDGPVNLGNPTDRKPPVVYQAPARFDDLIEVFIRTKRIGRTSMTSSYCAFRVDDDVLMCTAEQTMVFISAGTRRPTPIPDPYRRTIADFEGADLELAVPTG